MVWLIRINILALDFNKTTKKFSPLFYFLSEERASLTLPQCRLVVQKRHFYWVFFKTLLITEEVAIQYINAYHVLHYTSDNAMWSGIFCFGFLFLQTCSPYRQAFICLLTLTLSKDVHSTERNSERTAESNHSRCMISLRYRFWEHAQFSSPRLPAMNSWKSNSCSMENEIYDARDWTCMMQHFELCVF